MLESQVALSPTRLTLARHLRGLTRVELAAACGMSRRTVTDYEKGHHPPSLSMANRLAQELRVTLDFLTAAEVDTPPAEAISFRSLSRLPARTRDRACAMATLGGHLADWLAREFDLPKADLPDWQYVDPEAAAEGLRAEWGLGVHPCPSMVSLLETHGVRVFSLARLADQWVGLDGLSFWHGVTPVVLIDTAMPASRLRMSLAHELGHLVLHRAHGMADRRTAEHEAAKFAAAFLLPRENMRACGVRTASIDALVQLKAVWGTSVAALARRLYEVDMLSEWSYRQAYIQLSSLGWRKGEPEHTERPLPSEASVLLRKVFAALRMDGTTRPAVAQALHLAMDDLDTLLVGLVPTTVAPTVTPQVMEP